MRRIVYSLLVCVIAAWTLGSSPVQAGSGFYLSSNLGANFAPVAEFTGASNDRSSVCDEFINPLYASAEGQEPGCTVPNRGADDSWKAVFDSAKGILSGSAVGYRFGGDRVRFGDRFRLGCRLELEYFYRESQYNQTSHVTSLTGVNFQKAQGELVQAEERLGSITSHNPFGNVYLSLTSDSRLTPYVGFGAGFGIMSVDWGSVWARNTDPDAITTGDDQPNAAEIGENLASTVSVAQATLNDMLLGYQALFGADFALTESASLGVKGRWVSFDSFRGGGEDLIWHPLRSHAPNLRLDGSEPVDGWMSTPDTGMLAVSVNMKHHF